MWWSRWTQSPSARGLDAVQGAVPQRADAGEAGPDVQGGRCAEGVGLRDADGIVQLPGGGLVHVQDLEADYTPYELMEDEIEPAVPYLVDGMRDPRAQDGKLSIQLPDAVELQIAECAPSMRARA